MSVKTIKNKAIIEFEERRSRFIGYIKPVSSVSDAELFIEYVKKEHCSATHNVPLYRVIENGQEYLKYNDDGEPLGTAGKPMADIALIKNIYNFSLVAVRYFGGVKLGAGGLIRAYAKTAKLAFSEAGISDNADKLRYELVYNYDMTSYVNEFINRYKINANHSYADCVKSQIEVDTSLKEEVESLYNIDVKLLD